MMSTLKPRFHFDRTPKYREYFCWDAIYCGSMHQSHGVSTDAKLRQMAPQSQFGAKMGGVNPWG